jgi:hypothetical protein
MIRLLDLVNNQGKAPAQELEGVLPRRLRQKVVAKPLGWA